MAGHLAGFFLGAGLLVLGGCVVYAPEPGYYHGPGYHYQRYHYQGPPIRFHFRYHRGWHGLNEPYDYAMPVFLVEYWDTPLMCLDPGAVGQETS